MSDKDRIDFLASLAVKTDDDVWGEDYVRISFSYSLQEHKSLRDAIDAAMMAGRAA